MKSSVKKFIPLTIVILIFSLILAILKYVFHHIGPHTPWMSYTYFYGIGIPIYIFMTVLLIRLKAIRLSYRPDRLFITVVTLGFTALVIVHFVWTWLALNLPYKGVL